MSFEESYCVKLVSARTVDFCLAKVDAKGSEVLEWILKNSRYTVMNIFFDKGGWYIALCKGAWSNLPSGLNCRKEIKGAVLYRFVSFGAACFGALGKVFLAAERSNTEILAVSQSDIGISVCARGNLPCFERQIEAYGSAY